MSDQTQMREPDPVDWANYSDGGGGKPLPPKGEYTLVVSKLERGATREGYLQYTIDAKVVDPGKPWDGHETRFNRFSTKKWPNRNGNPLADYARAHGITASLNSNSDYDSAIPATQGRQFRALLDWEAYNTATQFSLKGEDAFPTDATGRKQTSVIDPQTKDKIFANCRIKYPISAVTK